MPLTTGEKVIVSSLAGAGAAAAIVYGLSRLKTTAPTKPGPCTSNSDCPGGYVCVSGACVPSSPPTGCTSNSDCPTGYVCSNGQCVPGTSGPTPCTSNSDCPSGYVCVNGACVTSTSGQPPTAQALPYGCWVDSECPPGMACAGGQTNSLGVPLSPVPNFYTANVMGFCTAKPATPYTLSSGPFAGTPQMCYPGVASCPSGYACSLAVVFPWPTFFIDPLSDVSNAGPVAQLQSYVCYPTSVPALPTPLTGAPGSLCSTNSECGAFAFCIFGVCQNPPTWSAAQANVGPIWINAYGSFPTQSSTLSIPIPCTSNAGCPPGTSCGSGPAGAGWCAGPIGGVPPAAFSSCYPGASCPPGYTCTTTDLGSFCLNSTTLSSTPYGGCLNASDCPTGYTCAMLGYIILPGDGGSWASQCVPTWEGKTSVDLVYPSYNISAMCGPSTSCPSGSSCFQGYCYKSRATGSPAALNGGYINIGGFDDGGTGFASNTIQCITASDCPPGWNCLGTGACSSVTGTSNLFFTPAELSKICPPGYTCPYPWPQNEFQFSCGLRATYGLSGSCPQGTMCVGGTCVSIPNCSDCGTATGFQCGVMGYCGPNGCEPAWIRPCAKDSSGNEANPPCPPGTSCYGGVAYYPGILACNSQGLCVPLVGVCLQTAVINGVGYWGIELDPRYYNPNAKVYCSTNSDCLPGFVCYGNGICMCASSYCNTVVTPPPAVSDATPLSDRLNGVVRSYTTSSMTIEGPWWLGDPTGPVSQPSSG
jgi:Cys-rich repeat protein